MSQATICMEYDDNVLGINIIDYDGDVFKILSDYYPTYDEVDTLINMGCCTYLSETCDDSDFVELEDGSVEILEAPTVEDFVLLHGDTMNFQFDIENEEWVQI